MNIPLHPMAKAIALMAALGATALVAGCQPADDVEPMPAPMDSAPADGMSPAMPPADTMDPAMPQPIDPTMPTDPSVPQPTDPMMPPADPTAPPDADPTMPPPAAGTREPVG